MKVRSRLKHSAAGLLSRFVGRNNDYQGFWALGLLYRGVQVPPWHIELDLLSGTASPINAIAACIAARESAYLRAALSKQMLDWQCLQRASLTLQFNADVSVRYTGANPAGEPFLCTVELVLATGQSASSSVTGRCAAWAPGHFTGRVGAVVPQL
ncbi:hypothetical protein ASF61_21025 [Duganella sp. Leaf126]|uniref:hypothetical protein n=1 Tax=Duganella sp. Leaf126 TaxID=1736266 RepID=UPI0006F3131C|nr:hypothetical protein [Duganella sp. Leaf126]KQQ45115.1 hypothetical protein ASF61_21025 [Duganella sp. Leaf126]